MTSRELVKSIINFEGMDRYAYDFPDPYGSDIYWEVRDHNNPDNRLANGVDEWGCVWKTRTRTTYGEVTKPLINDWDEFDKIKIPDITDPNRWKKLEGMREAAGDKYLLVQGMSLYERIYFVRGIEDTWMDLYSDPEQIQRFIDILVDMNLEAIKRFSTVDPDGYIIGDDWGLQKQLMISPDMWRQFWKPAYAKVFDACHKAGMQTFLHSCGYIVDILDDLIEIGLDVYHTDQQQNMGLEVLGEKFGGRLTFFATVDIQNMMIHGSPSDVRRYCRQMDKYLGREKGGLIPRWYVDPASVGHTWENISAMCDEFIKISKERFGK